MITQYLFYCMKNWKYVGSVKNNKLHGRGTYTYSNGDVYEGEWKNGLKDGWGTLKCKTGDTKFVKWKENKEHRHGCSQNPKGDIFSTVWCNGVLKSRKLVVRGIGISVLSSENRG